MKKAAIISLALLMIAAATSADAQYQWQFHRERTIVLERRDFEKSPEREHIQNDLFRHIYGVKELPTAVRDYLIEIAGPKENEWRNCGPRFLKQQFVFAGVSDDHVIVYYDQGRCRPYSGRFRFDIFSFKQDFSFDSKSFDPSALNPFFVQRDCHGCSWYTPPVIPAKDVIHRGSGSTNKKLKTIEELKAAILASRAE